MEKISKFTFFFSFYCFHFEFSPCQRGCALYNSYRKPRQAFTLFRTFHRPPSARRPTQKDNYKPRAKQKPQFGDWPGVCAKNRCTMPLCRAIKIFKRWNQNNKNEILTFYFGAFDTTSGENLSPDPGYWQKYTKTLSEYLKV